MKPVVPKDKVLSRLGSTEKIEQGGRIGELIDNCMQEAAGLIEPMGCCEDFDVNDVSDAGVELDGFKIQSRDVAELLRNCGRATLFAVTIGKGIEKRTEELKDRPAEALIFDAIGSEATEALAEQANSVISKRAEDSGYETTRRFSCGYGDWILENQKKIAEILNIEEIGITLTEAGLMVPQKSVTALLGWRK